MTAVMKREIKNYLKRPFFWIGFILVILGVYQTVCPYLTIRYVHSEEEIPRDLPESVHEGEVFEGYVPSEDKQRRKSWEGKMRDSLILNFQMTETEAESVIGEMKQMDIGEACEYLEQEYHYFGAIYVYRDTAYRQGTMEEINRYMEGKLKEHRFSYYFSRKFADFAGLFMGFFATVLLSVLFLQDTRKHTYELLHTKPVSATGYVLGKIMGGFLVCLTALFILNLLFWVICRISTKGNGFEVWFTDFILASCLYILPNMLMIVCVYGLISLLFQNPLPAVPLLVLYMVYSNMGSRRNGVFGYYGRPLAIMVRFPGQFFDTAPPPMALYNQSFLLLAAVGIIFFCIWLWKRRRM